MDRFAGTVGTPTTLDGGTTWSVPVTGLVGNGVFGIHLVDNDSIRDAVSIPLGGTGNQSFTGGATFTLDQTPATVVSIERLSPTASHTNSGSVSFTVTFSQDVVDVDASDFAIGVVSGSVAGVIGATPVSGSMWTVSVTGLTGQGQFRLNLLDDNSIRDAAGNPLGGAVVQNFMTGATYVLDTQGPLVAFIQRQTPTNQLTNAIAVSFLVGFNEPVVGVESRDFQLVAVTGSVSGFAVGGRRRPTADRAGACR